MLDAKLKQYKHTHGKTMSCEALAQMLSSTLYYRRFFPYYTYNIIAGIDNQGKGITGFYVSLLHSSFFRLFSKSFYVKKSRVLFVF